MRRQFRSDLLVTTPPKMDFEKMKSKDKSRHNEQFRLLLKSWIDQCGNDFDKKELAKSAVVSMITVNSWLRGQPAGKLSLWPICTYFERLLGVPRKQLYNDIIKTLNRS